MAFNPVISKPLTYQKAHALARKLGLYLSDWNSNHLTPTINVGIAVKFQHFFKKDNGMSDRIVIKRKLVEASNGYPYKPARLVPDDGDMTKPWYILFYLFDVGKQKVVRKRVLKAELERIPDRERRIWYAWDKMNQINQCLHMGMYAEGNPEKKLPGFNFRGYSIIDGINYAMNYKLDIEGVKPGSVSSYKKVRTVMKDFLQQQGLPANYSLRMINHTFVNTFFPYLKETRKLMNKTYNYYRMTLHAAIQVLMKKDPKLFPNGNPIADVKFLKTESRKHAAYTPVQLQDINVALKKAGHLDVLLFIQFMFYTLARPKELEALKVGHIFLNERRILFVSESAKTSIEGYVGISNHFAEIIEASGIMNYPGNYYVFSRDKRPGTERVGKNYFYKKLIACIEDLGLYEINKHYTLYSFKHSGAISLYQATKDIKLLQAQCRHQNIDQTNNYLRDLGLFRNFELLNKWEGPL